MFDRPKPAVGCSEEEEEEEKEGEEEEGEELCYFYL